MSKSNYLENALLNHVFGAVTFTPPATLYVALHSTSPADDDSGTELTGTSYARVAVTNNTTNWPSVSDSSKENGTEVAFPTAGSGGWGTASHFGVYDAATDGNLLYHGALPAPNTIDEGDTPSFPAGSLVFTED